MPSLKMKMKSTTGCLREKNGLHICPKSSKISKKSSLDIKNFQQEAQLETCTSNKQDDCFCNEVTIQEIRSSEGSCCEFLDKDNIHVQEHLSPSNDDATLYRMDHTQATCPSTIETIFSPIPESINNDNEAAASDDRGSQKDLAVPSPGDNNSDASSRNTCDYQSCNVSDFFISDMFVSISPTERSSAYAVTEATCLPDYECDGSSRFFDDEYMILPFLEESVETGNDCDDNRVCSEPVMVSEESSLHLAIHQLRSNPEPDVNTYPEWDPAECLDPLMFIRTLPDLSEAETNFNPTIPAREKNPITLVLDLDETLVHSSLEHCDDADFTFPVSIDFKEHIVYVKQRPYLREFLERVSEMFQIVVFTASQSVYAKQLLDILDPDGKIISRRAYRESCIFADGSYTKDLTVLGVDLAKVAIIDNSPQVFRLQVNNGIPIKSWFDDPSDCALISLLPFLETLVNAEDVRPIIAKRFGNKEQLPLVSHYFT